MTLESCECLLFLFYEMLSVSATDNFSAKI